jgi:Flp pilus assembly protein TadD
MEACREAVRLAAVRPESADSPPGSQAMAQAAMRELVELLVTARDAAAARETFDRLAALTSNRDELALVEAYLLRLEGRFDESLARVEAAGRRQPERGSASVELLFLRGVVLVDLERFADAAEQLAEVVRLAPHHKEAHYKLAQALQRTGRSVEARQHLETSARLTKLVEEHLALQERLAESPAPATFRRLAEVSQQLGRDREAAYWRSRAAAP